MSFRTAGPFRKIRLPDCPKHGVSEGRLTCGHRRLALGPGAFSCPSIPEPRRSLGAYAAPNTAFQVAELTVIPGGLEPPAYGLGNRRSIRLSYGTGIDGELCRTGGGGARGVVGRRVSGSSYEPRCRWRCHCGGRSGGRRAGSGGCAGRCAPPLPVAALAHCAWRRGRRRAAEAVQPSAPVLQAIAPGARDPEHR